MDEISDNVKSLEDSVNEIWIVFVCPVLIQPGLAPIDAMAGAVVSLVVVSAAWAAELPARSSTSAVMVSVPSSREERSRLESE